MTDTCQSTPKCPWCGTAKHTREGSQPKTWYCGKCSKEFEAEDDGDITYGRPEKRMEREERQRARRPHECTYKHGRQAR